MHKYRLTAPITVVIASLLVGPRVAAFPDRHPAVTQTTTAEKKAAMLIHAKGTFDVKMVPQPRDEKAGDRTVGRMSLEKQFHGDLDATSKGEMLAVMTGVNGSAGYVAMERVNGTLAGRTGTFALQHTGTMTRGEPQLSVTVVPDSGTGDLVGLTGTMTIDIVDGKHFYGFDYSLPERPR
jgi:hypothetical protein